MADMGPFKNSSRAGLLEYLWGGSAQKNVPEFQGLVDFLASDDFQKADIKGMNVQRDTAELDAHLAASNSEIRDGWKPATTRWPSCP